MGSSAKVPANVMEMLLLHRGCQGSHVGLLLIWRRSIQPNLVLVRALHLNLGGRVTK